MSREHARTKSRDRVVSLYQVDPGFYEKIISRNPSLGGSSIRRSVYLSAANGKVPFLWEMEPGEPRFRAAVGEATPPITLPPRLRLHALRPSPPGGLPPVGCLHKSTKKMMGKRTTPIKLPWPVVSTAGAKAYLKSSIKKVKQIRYSAGHLGKKSDHNNKLEIPSSDHLDTDFTSSSRGNSNSSGSLSSSFSSMSASDSVPPSSRDKPGKLLKLWRLPRAIMGWKPLGRKTS